MEEIEAARQVGSASTQWYDHIEAFVRNGRAVALAALGEDTSAMREFDSSITLCAENAWVYYNRARVHEGTGNQEKACLDYQTALAKVGPALNLIQRERAEARVREIESQS